MDLHAIWRYILSRFRKQLPLDIEHCSPIALRHIIQDVRTPPHILDSIAHAHSYDEDVLRELVRCPQLSEATLAFIALTASEEMKGFIAGTRAIDIVFGDEAKDGHAGAALAGGRKKLNLMQQVQRMTTPQKIQLAMRGAKEARGLLVRDSNKQIALAVLDNPRLTDGEVESFAKSANLSEDVIRSIGMNPEWSKRYQIAHALVHNPKTPPGVAVPFVSRLPDRDLAMLEKNKNVSEAVRSAARSLLAKRKLHK